jgi:hypothetical protein
MGVTWAEHRSHREAVDPIEEKQRMVHVLVVVAMKEAQLLAPMGGIVRRVHIDRDQVSRAWVSLKVKMVLPRFA